MNDLILGNAGSGEWSRNSIFSEEDTLILEINALGNGADPTPTQSVSGSDLQPIPETGEHLFSKLCAPCHTIGVGPRVGPDLLDVSGRRSAEWLAAFIKKPSDFHARHDPVAKELAQDFPNVRMPDLRLGDLDVADLIAYLESVSRRVNGIVASAEAGVGEAAHHDTHNHQH
jgi:cytochrome c2